MELALHLILHFVVSIVIAFFVFKKWGSLNISLLGALIGGLFVDIDHLFDYFLAFGMSFNLNYFLKGYEFLKSDKIYVLFHGFEYVLIFLFISHFLTKRRSLLKSFLIALAFGLLSHLIIDSYLNKTVWQSYFISYRVGKNFELKELVTPKHYKYHMLQKQKMRL